MHSPLRVAVIAYGKCVAGANTAASAMEREFDNIGSLIVRWNPSKTTHLSVPATHTDEDRLLVDSNDGQPICMLLLFL
jgi:hypothetical protein